MTPREQRFRARHRRIEVWLTPQEYDRLQRQMRQGIAENPSQWVRVMLAEAESKRRSEAGQLIRKNVPLGLVQAAEALFMAEADRLLQLSRRYHFPGQWAIRQDLRREAGQYMDMAGWCREVIDAYTALGREPGDPTRPETEETTPVG